MVRAKLELRVSYGLLLVGPQTLKQVKILQIPEREKCLYFFTFLVLDYISYDMHRQLQKTKNQPK